MYCVIHADSGTLAIETAFETRAEAKRAADELATSDVMVSYAVRRVDRLDADVRARLEET
jgi:hypothetical protein